MCCVELHLRGMTLLACTEGAEIEGLLFPFGGALLAQANPTHEKYLNKKIDMYDEMATVVGNNIARGSGAKSSDDVEIQSLGAIFKEPIMCKWSAITVAMLSSKITISLKEPPPSASNRRPTASDLAKPNRIGIDSPPRSRNIMVVIPMCLSCGGAPLMEGIGGFFGGNAQIGDCERCWRKKGVKKYLPRWRVAHTCHPSRGVASRLGHSA
ncbi:hypothetical protein Cgig2_000434 [Carnegiea gigantea]|uniref:Uncharacterized protein n=1 Tax=Carnegiea gigantea TaxID=171969 RepID=A0A9Q1JPE8_9CARY|nr:hypothetical protein Cgig2_000434 [Carnegiea gigantea]